MKEVSPPTSLDRTRRHDLTNHLAAIRGYAELLLSEAAPDDPRRTDLDEIRACAVAALELLGRLEPTQGHADK